MGSVDRQKKRDMLWKKAILHFSLCFAMGFFTGFAPSSTNSDSVFTSTTKVAAPFSSVSPGSDVVAGERVFNRSLMSQAAASDQRPMKASLLVAIPEGAEDEEEEEHQRWRQRQKDETESMDSSSVDVDHLQQEPSPTPTTTTTNPRRLVILVTTARPGSHDPFRAASLARLANTLRLVPPPLLWVVVEPHAGSAGTAGMLRMTGIMYRHLVYRDNFTDANPTAEVDHQRNLALNHLEHHRIDGVVHFADMTNVYDLDFFHHIRAIEAFGTWPVAFVSPNRKRVVVEGPVCRESLVIGWHMNSMNTTTSGAYDGGNSSITATARIPRFNVWSFAFNSSILWDPERWGRSSSISDTSQDSFKFIQETVVEDNSKLLPIPADCTRVMIWRLHIPKVLYPGYLERSEPEPSQR